MATLQELKRQRDELDSRIRAAQRKGRGEAIKQVRALVAEYELMPGDIFQGSSTTAGRDQVLNDGHVVSKPAKKATPTTGRKVPMKYRDPKTKLEWSGRGKTPNWLRGQDRERFLIK